MRMSPPVRILLALAAAPWCVCAPHNAAPPFAVVVRNYAGAPRSVLAPAVEIARRAFHTAGVESQWTICAPETCGQDAPPEGPHLELFVMPALRMRMPGAVPRPAGYAMVNGFDHPRAYAFVEAAQAAANRTLRPLPLVLGCILMHEAGHLLGLKHQLRGAMRANLDGVDMDNAVRGWAFSSEERKELREAAARLAATRAIARR